MEGTRVKEYQTRVTRSIDTLKEKAERIETLTVRDAENLLMYTECISSSLQSFIFCSQQDAALSAEGGMS